jgi:hypothetical protein
MYSFHVPSGFPSSAAEHIDKHTTRAGDSKSVRAAETLTKHSGHMIRLTET